ncbi:MAG: hypothetical protein M5U22_18790 [Thermoleophilia bacterium]|nr:hypothetical protein [Thermoleophilia bacterium]
MYDREYVAARRALLDALEALGGQRQALVLVGAQAIYLHTGAGTLAVAEYTTDADIAVDPRLLLPLPGLAEAMERAGFFLDTLQGAVGIWSLRQVVAGIPAIVTVDLLVPEALGGAGRRAARMGGSHGKRTAMKAHGLEAAVVDNEPTVLGALDPADVRSFEIRVAGPAALLVSKVHKVAERVADAASGGREDRVKDKDALDILRLLRAVDPKATATRLHELTQDDLAGSVTEEAIARMPELFGGVASPGSLVAARAAAGAEDPDVIAASCVALVKELLIAVKTRAP